MPRNNCIVLLIAFPLFFIFLIICIWIAGYIYTTYLSSFKVQQPAVYCSFNNKTYRVDNIALQRGSNGICIQLGSKACPILYPNGSYIWDTHTINCEPKAIETCTFGGKNFVADHINLERYSSGVCIQLSQGACPILYPDGSYTWDTLTNNCEPKNIALKDNTSIKS